MHIVYIELQPTPKIDNCKPFTRFVYKDRREYFGWMLWNVQACAFLETISPNSQMSINVLAKKKKIMKWKFRMILMNAHSSWKINYIILCLFEIDRLKCWTLCKPTIRVDRRKIDRIGIRYKQRSMEKVWFFLNLRKRTASS